MIHSTADVQTDNIGEGTDVWQHTVILSKAKIGKDCNINAHCFIENDVTIGNDVTVKCGVSIWDGVRLADEVFVGPNVAFTNDLMPRSKQYPDSFMETLVEKGASLGANATIIAGVTIGSYSVLGAGSVLTKSMPSNTLWYGNPAVLHGYVCNCAQKLNENLVCDHCGGRYELDQSNKLRRLD